MIGSLSGYSGYSIGYNRFGAYSDKPGEKVFAKETSESVMESYYRENPEERDAQEARVKEGYDILSAQGFSAQRAAAMTENEYRSFMGSVIEKIPFHESRPYDEETVLISREGWDSMRQDTDYAAWIAGYLKEDRMIPNPYSGKGDKGKYCVHEFGASPDDYKGHSYSKILGGTSAGARTLYMAESEQSGIVTKGRQADAQPPKNYNIWEEMKRASRRKQEELIGADIQVKMQEKKQA